MTSRLLGYHLKRGNWYSETVGVPIIWPFTRAQHRAQYAGLKMSDFDAYPLASAKLADRVP